MSTTGYRANPTNANDLANKSYVDTAGGLLVPKSLVTTKGDLLIASGNGTVARLGVGSDGQSPSADSTAATGVKWNNPIGLLALAPKPTTGGTRYAVAGLKTGSGALNFALTLNTIYYLQLLVGASYTYDRIGCYVITGVAAKSARFGLYADDGTGRPGALIVDHGTVATATSGAGSEVTIGSPQAVTPGIYWAAILPEASITINGWNASTATWRGWMNSLSSSTFYGFVYTQAQAYGTLPSTATPVEAISNTAPDIRLRVA